MGDAAKLYLKRHTERLIKDVGYAAACALTGRSKATLGRYFSEDGDHADRFMPVDAVAALEAAASFPHVTAALAELNGGQIAHGRDRRNAPRGADERGVNGHVIALSQRFAILMAEYHSAIGDGIISVNEARRLLEETLELQKVLVEMKLRLEADSAG
ncbi:hypothetical protein [Roseicyclus persicicus]|uniref:Uncharacterized protein n=1 Tax=Roseicyclus persicicus TaxID=2650661 RepID=A0A7X6GXM7_9RHOB|nr:hypothetical protein [Roseibacterium persicicum]NKX44289.1 hypothetical protein [Roseibacterium persicicum]